MTKILVKSELVAWTGCHCWPCATNWPGDIGCISGDGCWQCEELPNHGALDGP